MGEDDLMVQQDEDLTGEMLEDDLLVEGSNFE